MRKKIVALGLVAVMSLSLAGCGNKYVKLGSYKGLNVDYTASKTEITNDDINSSMESKISEEAKAVKDKDYKAKKGDKVNIDYKGLKDGKAFEGGTATGYDLVLGSGTFIAGFEDGLIGAKKGQKLSLDLTFPKDYSNNKDLAGKKVVFKVTVNSITQIPKVEDLTDKYVKENLDGYNTVAEYAAAVKKELQDNLDESILEQKKTAAWNKVIDGCKIKKYPEDQVEKLEKQAKTYYENMAKQYGMELKDYIKQVGYTEDQFNEEIEKSAKEEAITRVVMDLIADKEKIKVTDADYDKQIQKYADQYNVTKDEFLKQVTDDDAEQIKVGIKLSKVQELVVKNSKMNLTKATATPGATADTSSSSK